MAILDAFTKYLQANQRPVLGAAAGLLGASGPSPSPISTGQALGQGLLGFMQGQDQQQAAQARQLQIQAAQDQIQQQQARRESLGGLGGMVQASQQIEAGGGSPFGPQDFAAQLLQSPGTQETGLKFLAAQTGKGADKPLSPIAKLLADRNRTAPGSKEREFMDRKLEMLTTPRAGTTFETTPGGVKFSQGGPVVKGGPGITLHKGPASKLQTSIAGRKFSQGRVTKIREAFDPRFLRFKDRLGLQLSDFRTKMQGIPLLGKKPSPEDKALIKQMTQFHQLVRQEFNAYRKEITGAAAAFKELEFLMDSFLNENLSETAFEAALDLYETELARGISIKEDLLQNGIRFGTKEYTDAFDDAWVSGRNPVQPQRLGDQTGQPQVIDFSNLPP